MHKSPINEGPAIHSMGPQNFDPDTDEYPEDEYEFGEGDVEIDIEDYLRAARRPVEVTRKNKIVCTAAFSVLIITVLGYLSTLVYFHTKYEIMSDLHFEGPTDIIYFVMVSDIVASVVGIWTCLKKTGPKAMIYACIWLLITSLINLSVTISLTFETKKFRDKKRQICESGNTNSDECTIYSRATLLLWCSLLTFAPKVTTIVLCRFNFPQVFNWMMGKDVYLDEDLLPKSKNIVSNPGQLGAAYFDPPDLARIAARGSLKDASIITGHGKVETSAAIFVTKEHPDGNMESDLHDAGGTREKNPNKRRSTFINL